MSDETIRFHYYKHPVTGHTWTVNEEWLPVLDALERAGRWVDLVDLERWSGVDSATPFAELVKCRLVEERWLESDERSFMQYRLWGLVQEEFPRGLRRRMKFAVGHPADIEATDFTTVGWAGPNGERLWSTWPSAERFSYDEVVSYVDRDDAVLVTTQDPRPLDAMGPDDWRDLQARLVLVRRGGVTGALTDRQAQEIMADYDVGLQNLSEIIRQRVVLDE